MLNLHHWRTALGLSLLYVSTFYLPLVGSYWLTSLTGEVLYPSIVAVLILTPVAAMFLASLSKGAIPKLLAATVIAGLCWVGLLSTFRAAGYSAMDIALITLAPNKPMEAVRWLRVEIVAAAIVGFLVLVFALRKSWPNLLRFLSILGFSFVALALIRSAYVPREPPGAHGHVSFSNFGGEPIISSADAAKTNPSFKSRQVVWIIMDELDYNQTLGVAGGPKNPPMPNLEQLAHVGVTASQAYSPAKDTLASIPALLTGYPLLGLDFLGKDMWIKTESAGTRILQESDSVFGRLPDGPDSAAVLGYYHPYCALFPDVKTCVAAPEANVGRWFDALVFFSQPAIAAVRWIPNSSEYIPNSFFRTFEPMYRISEKTWQEFPRFLAMTDKSLVFMHINLPHPPGDFSQRQLGLSTVGDDHEGYRRNLKLVDQLIGIATTVLSSRSNSQDILLIVSSDHWHRVDSPTIPQRIPWIAWHVGDNAGVPLAIPINTVHTAELVLAFLRGRVQTQDQIALWWGAEPMTMPLMPHGTQYDGLLLH
jgi:hypothetical protein